jgi:hypothetical protein
MKVNCVSTLVARTSQVAEHYRQHLCPAGACCEAPLGLQLRRSAGIVGLFLTLTAMSEAIIAHRMNR